MFVNRLLLAGIAFWVSIGGNLNAQSGYNYCDKTDKVIAAIRQYHYDPITFTSEVKQQMVANYVQQIDPRIRYFSTDDIRDLQQKASSDGLCAAFTQSVPLYLKRVREYDSLLKAYLAKPVKFIKGETIVANASTTKHLRSDRASMIGFREKVLRYKLLGLFEDKVDQDSLSIKSEKDFSVLLEKELREKLLHREKIIVNRLIGDPVKTENRLFESFLNTIAMRFDPHTNYFSGEDKNEFDESLSREQKSFGLALDENDNFEIQVAGLQPGSSAFNSNQIFEDDIIESITDTKGVVHELTGQGMEFVTKIVRDPLNNQLTFNIRQKNNTLNAVTLVKTKIENVENAFRGYLLSDEKSKIGYIALPSFYTDNESDNQLGCANDVAKEILLLKKDGIQGLVLDLRNNGGGSLKEAIEISGLFIDEGPMCIFKSKNEKPYLMKDMNRGTVYDGPLIVLVNSLSASASEFVSGCLQDYGRALVVGDQTYGKGSAQSIYPVDSLGFLTGESKNGYVKVTNGKFYHVSRRSNQEKGVMPEVIVPDLYSSMKTYREEFTPYHLPFDSVAKKVLYNKLTHPFTSSIIEASRKRIKENNRLQQMVSLSDSLNKIYSQDQIIPLQPIEFLAYSKKLAKAVEKAEKALDNKQEGFKVNNHSFANELLKYDVVEQTFNKEIMEDMLFDDGIAESFLILRDLINFGK